MVNIIKIFWGSTGKSGFVILSLLLLAGLIQSIGLAGLISLFSLAQESGEQTFQSSNFLPWLVGVLGLPHRFDVVIIIALIAALLRFVISIVSLNAIGQQMSRLGARLRIHLIGSLLRTQWRHLTSQPVARYTHSLWEEANDASECYMNAGIALSKFLQFLVYVAYIMSVQWQVAVGATIIAPLVWLLMRRLRRNALRSGRQRNRKTKDLHIKVADILTNMKSIKASGQPGVVSRMLQKETLRLHNNMKKETLAEEVNRYIQEPVMALMLCIAIYLLIEIWRQPIAQVMTLGLLLVWCLDSFRSMQTATQRALILSDSFWSIRAVIAEAESAQEQSFGDGVASLSRAIELRDVSFSYGEKKILDHVDVEIPANQVTVLLGQSGAGKTTIADLIAGLHRANEGDVLVDGIPVTHLNLRHWQSQIGYVSQETILIHDTIFHNITLGDPSFSRADVEDALKAAGAWSFVSALPSGLDHVVGERGLALSGGQRQRLSIARALLVKPKLLILDEATSALDDKTAREICETVHAMTVRTTILAITHQELWTSVADRFYRIMDGRADVALTPAPNQKALRA